LLFGGRLEPGAVVNDTWAWDGTGWRELDTGGAGGPPPGEGSVMAWDAAMQSMVLVTTSSTGGGETWIWFEYRWVQQMRGYVPRSAFVGAMAFDPVTQSLVAVCCCQAQASAHGTVDTTWGWDGSASRPRSATAPGLAHPGYATGSRLVADRVTLAPTRLAPHQGQAPSARGAF
jgi:hypothetical protein